MPQTDLNAAQKNAKRIGVEVKPSAVKGKKLDVYKNHKKVASIGDKKYEDFLLHGDPKRKANYKARHQKTRTKVGTASYYADQILWT